MSKFKNVEQIMALPIPLSYPYFMFCVFLLFLSVFIWVAFGGMLLVSRTPEKHIGFFWTQRREFAQFSGVGIVHDTSEVVLYNDPEERKTVPKKKAALAERTEVKPETPKERGKMSAVELLEARRRKKREEHAAAERAAKTDEGAAKTEERLQETRWDGSSGGSFLSNLFGEDEEKPKTKVEDATAKDSRSVVGSGKFASPGMRFYFPYGALRNWMRASVGMALCATLLLAFRMFSYKRFMDAQAADGV